jgi:hypothetical protein
MRKAVVIAVVLGIAGCSRSVTVPTEAQFEQSPDLLKTWIDKCQHGEYSNLGAEEKQRMCGSAQAAANVLTERQAAKAADDSFGNAILRK